MFLILSSRRVVEIQVSYLASVDTRGVVEKGISLQFGEWEIWVPTGPPLTPPSMRGGEALLTAPHMISADTMVGGGGGRAHHHRKVVKVLASQDSEFPDTALTAGLGGCLIPARCKWKVRPPLCLC